MNRLFVNMTKIILTMVMVISICACQKQEEPIPEDIPSDPIPVEPEPEQERISVKAVDEGEIVFYSHEGYYRYGPSIMEYEDGSYDVWFSAPGNSSTQWDWITYRHSDDGVNWSEEQTVLKPTPGSKDQCSVCDPAVIRFGGYYYLAYTGTWDYEREGMNNSLFVARSEYPDGPFEKWNGEGWGGDPEPIIEYTGDPEGWGIGEPSFVIRGDDLSIYYSYIDLNWNDIRLYKADLSEDWPLTLRYKTRVLSRVSIDSLDVVYDEKLDTFLGFSINYRMSEVSKLAMFMSGSGKEFDLIDTTDEYIESFAHNMGIAKSPEGHINSDNEILIGYAYGEDWGRWNTRFQKIKIQ